MAGVLVGKTDHDYGVDGHFREVQVLPNGQHVDAGVSLDFQAKATTVFTREQNHIAYDLDARAYNNLVRRGTYRTTLILILLCLPRSRSDWHELTTAGTVLRDHCYWFVLPPGPETGNTSSVRIKVPTSQRFSPEALKKLLALEQARCSTTSP